MFLVCILFLWNNNAQRIRLIPPVQRVILYPQYIDAAKTVAEGRRIPKSLGRYRYDDSIM